MKKSLISEGANFVLDRLNMAGYSAYVVGGCVRDIMLKKTPSDFDVTTSATSEDMERLFSDCRLITLGKEFGTIGILHKGETIETTTFRRDGAYLDGRHPSTVDFSGNLSDDLMRRDFTINAMAMDIDGNILDEYGGTKDLENKIIRAVGNPEKRFGEDKLRMLRAVRFATTLDFEIEEDTFSAIQQYAAKINEVSVERIQVELNKILISDNPKRGFELLLDSGLMKMIFPELMATVGYDQMSPYHHKNLFMHILCVVNDVPKKLYLKLAALFHDISKVHTLSIDEKGVGHFYGHEILGAEVATRVLKRLRYDNKTIERVNLLIENHMKAHDVLSTKALKRQINRVGEDLIFDLLDLMISDVRCTREGRDVSFLEARKLEVEEILNSEEPINERGLKINGHDLIQIGYNEGRELGLIIKKLTEMVIDDPALNEKEILINIAREWLTEDK